MGQPAQEAQDAGAALPAHSRCGGAGRAAQSQGASSTSGLVVLVQVVLVQVVLVLVVVLVQVSGASGTSTSGTSTSGGTSASGGTVEEEDSAGVVRRDPYYTILYRQGDATTTTTGDATSGDATSGGEECAAVGSVRVIAGELEGVRGPAKVLLASVTMSALVSYYWYHSYLYYSTTTIMSL